MTSNVSFPISTSQAEETTGKYVITFRDDATTEGLAILRDQSGISGLASAADFPESALDFNQIEAKGDAVFPTLGIAVVSLDEEALHRTTMSAAEDSAILSIEPERIFYANSNNGLSIDYLKGYRDAVDNLYMKAVPSDLGEEIRDQAVFQDDAGSTWGLKATKVITSRYTGAGIKIAVLDTGFDFQHPDFQGRSILSKSFIPGEVTQDGHSHGTHCIGTAAGFKDLNGRRYGISYKSTIYVGKVLSNAGSGSTSGILAGIEWAIVNGVHVISMSLGDGTSQSPAYETVSRRALQNGSLVIAAAGNNGPGTVTQPANSPSIMAVAAVNNTLTVASFSATSGPATGANVDITGPGVNVYSSVPVNKGRYASFNGTSMATPHVAGIAALYAQALNVRGPRLWQILTSRALRIPQPNSRVGSGLVQAPQ
jgi:subtilisin family serine protease